MWASSLMERPSAPPLRMRFAPARNFRRPLSAPAKRCFGSSTRTRLARAGRRHWRRSPDAFPFRYGVIGIVYPTRALSTFCESEGIPFGARIRFCGLLQTEGGAAMGYSNDLRVRVIQVVEGGAAARAAARQFVIGDSTAIRWTKRWRETGSYEAKSNRGQSRSPLKKHEEWLLALVQQEPDLRFEEIRSRLLYDRGQKAGLGSVWRFFNRHGISFKKKHSRSRTGSA